MKRKCDFAAYDASQGGSVVLGFATDGSHDYAVKLTPAGLLSLEAKLAELREAHKALLPPQ